MTKSKFALGHPSLLGLLAVAGLILLAVLSRPAQAADDPTGTWTAQWDTVHSGIDELTLTLKKEGAEYSGIISDTLDFINKDTPLTDLKVESESVSFSFPAMGGEAEFGMMLTLAGDKMTGQLIFKAKNGGPVIEFVRKK
jgi:hypothetical protein